MNNGVGAKMKRQVKILLTFRLWWIKEHFKYCNAFGHKGFWLTVRVHDIAPWSYFPFPFSLLGTFLKFGPSWVFFKSSVKFFLKEPHLTPNFKNVPNKEKGKGKKNNFTGVHDIHANDTKFHDKYWDRSGTFQGILELQTGLLYSSPLDFLVQR